MPRETRSYYMIRMLKISLTQRAAGVNSCGSVILGEHLLHPMHMIVREAVKCGR